MVFSDEDKVLIKNLYLLKQMGNEMGLRFSKF